MQASEIIMKKRDGGRLSRDEIGFIIRGCTGRTIPDYQISAWLMAVFLRGMDDGETACLTDAMLHSGTVMDLSGIPGISADKHSTGGVGDKISIPLAPIVAACGVPVPMMSGRALGHTGGTLDKLDSISGYRTSLSETEFKSILRSCGYAMTGQTETVAPADRILYALRDVTGTVESIPLITASILSKKAAEGTDALVFDVKCGRGAFMKTQADAERLAGMLVKTGKALGKKCAALITRMENPLGTMTGNFLEIEESVDILEGKGPADTTELTLALAAKMCMLAGKCATPEEGRQMAEQAVSGGQAMECFLRNVAAQGGNPDQLLAERGKRRSPWKAEIRADRSGYLAGIDAYAAGMAGIPLGVGRTRTDEPVFPEAGVIFRAKPGEKVQAGDILMEVYGKNQSGLDEGVLRLQQAVYYTEEKPEEPESLLLKEIDDDESK